jgi:hypothetical protein
VDRPSHRCCILQQIVNGSGIPTSTTTTFGTEVAVDMRCTGRRSNIARLESRQLHPTRRPPRRLQPFCPSLFANSLGLLEIQSVDLLYRRRSACPSHLPFSLAAGSSYEREFCCRFRF